MNELCLASYIKIMRVAFMQNDGNESATALITDAINKYPSAVEDGYYEDLNPKKVSKILNRKSPVPDGWRSATFNSSVTKHVINYFKDIVLKDLNNYTYQDQLQKLVRLVTNDDTISNSKKNELLELYEKGELGDFLGELFLYVCNRDNTITDDILPYQDIPYLDEASYACPITNKRLVEQIKNVPVKRYRIVQIFPDNLTADEEAALTSIYPKPQDLDSPSNLIALHRDYADEYMLGPDPEEYKKLYETKKALVRSYKAKNIVNNVTLEDDIRKVLDVLMSVNGATPLVPLSYDALNLDEKFRTENFLLKTDTQAQVLTYYKYIEKVFSETGSDFDIIASEIKTSSLQLENSGMTQAEIIDNLSEWIRNKAGLDIRGLRACNIVVSFFIQNCEVFSSEISK